MLKITLFTFECDGDVLDKVLSVANGGANEIEISTIGFIGISSTLVWKIPNPQKFLDAISRGILSNVDAFIYYVTGGGLTIQVVAKTDEAADALMQMYESEEMLRNLNRATAEYAAGVHQDELGQFRHIYLINCNERDITKADMSNIEQRSASSFEGFKANQQIPDNLNHLNAYKITLDRDDNDTAVLGNGTFGAVLLCYHERYNRCAVKCMEPVRDDNNEVSFLKEAGIFLKADHPNIVRVFGITSWSRSFGIIMEYMERGNLSVLIESARTHKFQIPFNLLVRILLQVANGVAFLHKIGEDQQIVHGDLKPSNIVLKDDFTAKVADFGGATLRTYTKTGEVASRDAENTVHTPLYTAPERLAKLFRPATKASDVYSYGMIIYECLSDASACRLKFDKNADLRWAIINDKFELPRDRIEKKKNDYNGEQLLSLLCLEQCMEKCRQFNKENRQKMIVIRNQLQLHFDKVAQKNVLNSIAEVSSNLGSCTKTPASSSQLICLKHLSPPSFRPSHVPLHVSVNKEFFETKPLIKSSSSIVETTLFQEGETKPLMASPPTTNNSVLDEKILPLVKEAETAVISGHNPETALQALNNALEETGELGTVDSTRLVYELHLLCQKFNETGSLAVRELIRHCLKRCLGIEDKNVRKGYHDSFLEKL
ncbi:uncharacterized protein LOC100183375 [Ciona intestinalis]